MSLASKGAELAWSSCSSRPFSWTMRNPLYKKPTSPKLLPLWIGLPSRLHIIATHAPPLPKKSKCLAADTPILPHILAASAQNNDSPPLSGPLGRVQLLLLQPAANTANKQPPLKAACLPLQHPPASTAVISLSEAGDSSCKRPSLLRHLQEPASPGIAKRSEEWYWSHRGPQQRPPVPALQPEHGVVACRWHECGIQNPPSPIIPQHSTMLS